MLLKLSKLIIVGLIISMSSAFAQKGVEDGSKYGHGEDSIRCLQNLSLYTEYYKQNNFQEAYPYWLICFNECPASTLNLYADGERILISLYQKEKDEAKKEVYYQLLMKGFDQRVQYFGDHGKYPASYIKAKKAITMLRYHRDDKEVVKEAHQLFSEAVVERGTKTQGAILITYMSTSVTMFKYEEISAENLVSTYTIITDILDKQLEQSKKDADELAETKSTVESLFANSGAATCEVIETIFAPQLSEHTSDLKWLVRVNRLLARGDCGESELFYKTSEYRHAIEPDASSAFGLAKMYLKTKNLDKAISYYEEAISLETEEDRKAIYYYQLGLVYMSQNNFSQARSNANKAIEIRSDWGDPYILIGKAYASTASSYGSNEFEHKTVYWVVVDKFIKAKSIDVNVATEAQNLIVLYSQHFPKTEEIFFQNLKEGSTYKVGGWINESTTIRAKK